MQAWDVWNTPLLPPSPLPLAPIIFRYAKVWYLWQRMQTFLPKVYLESQSLDWACLRLIRFCLSWKSADKEMWIHLKGKVRGISYPENREFKVAVQLLMPLGVLVIARRKKVSSWPVSPLLLEIFSFLFSNPQFQERVKRKHPNTRKEQAVTVLVSDFYPIWNF